jgi:hypothetical protein
MDKEAVHRALKELVAFTEREGFFLTGVHYESRPSERLEVWAALILDCRGDEVSDIVVPSADHFHSTPEIAAFMREELAEKVKGTVWLADHRRAAPGSTGYLTHRGVGQQRQAPGSGSGAERCRKRARPLARGSAEHTVGRPWLAGRGQSGVG